MSKQTHCCQPGQSLEQTAQMMWDQDCGCLPVCGGDGAHKIVGMITDRDIAMCALFEGKPLRDICVSQAMAREVLTCNPNDSLAEAEKKMRDAKIRRLPVVDENECVVGMISLADLAQEAARESMASVKNITEMEVGNTLAAICTPGR
ncbi:CBS domain-containing protein [Methylomonas sp. MgM2]